MIWVNKKGQPIAVKGKILDCKKCPCDPCLENECVFTPVYSSVFHMARYGGMIVPYLDINAVEVNGVLLPMTWNSFGDGGYNIENEIAWIAESSFAKDEGETQHRVGLKVTYYNYPESYRLTENGSSQILYKARYDLRYYKYVNGEPVYASGKDYTARYYFIALAERFVLDPEGFNIVAGSGNFPGGIDEIQIPAGDNVDGRYDLQAMIQNGNLSVNSPDFLHYRGTGATCYYSNVMISAENLTIKFKNESSLKVGVYVATIDDCPCPTGIEMGVPGDTDDDVSEEIELPGGGSSGSGTSSKSKSLSKSSGSSEDCPAKSKSFEIYSEESYSEVVETLTAKENLYLEIISITKLTSSEDVKFILHNYMGETVEVKVGDVFYFLPGDYIDFTLEVPVSYGTLVSGSAYIRYKLCPIDEIPGKCVYAYYYTCDGVSWQYNSMEELGFFPDNTADEAGYIDGEEVIVDEQKIIYRVVDTVNKCDIAPEIPAVGSCSKDCSDTIRYDFIPSSQLMYIIQDPGVGKDKMLYVQRIVHPVIEGTTYPIVLYRLENQLKHDVFDGSQMFLDKNYSWSFFLDIPQEIMNKDPGGKNGYVEFILCEMNSTAQRTMLAEMGE